MSETLSFEELHRVIDEVQKTQNYWLINAVKRMADELRRLKEQHSMASFIQGIEEQY